MSSFSAEQFDEFYQAVNGHTPFPWQTRLAHRVCDPNCDWPRAVSLPTAAGKTACIDIAVFALACQAELGAKRRSPRRICFVVDRRIVVDQAYDHARELADALKKSEGGILAEVSRALCGLADGNRPLDVYALRGGMYRETAWARSPLQPTVLASTVDQIGSRLLFRGYGVSDSMKPIHAGLVGNDAIILLDEAHCSKPFDQTAQFIDKYRRWADEPPCAPFGFVSITATPTKEIVEAELQRVADEPDGLTLIECDNEDDRAHRILGPRLSASKPARLEVAKHAKGKNAILELAKSLADHACRLANEYACVGIFVNRVATAREVKAILGPDAVLLTGRMRPVDRDRMLKGDLLPLFSNAEGDPPRFVVGTQCLEVGADFDFHALVTECASLDSLRQRFGRLNRVARRPSALAVVVVRADQAEDSELDPVYGASLARTWKWLNEKADNGSFDFGISAVRLATENEDLASLNAPSLDAPVLFPAHLDCWVQTHPIPTPDPDPAVFLHGPRTGVPDVQVVFRNDLGGNEETWSNIVSLCPPSSSEAVAVPINIFRRWLEGIDVRDESSDVEGEDTRTEDAPKAARRYVLRWKGPSRSEVISDATVVRPGDTFVISASETGLHQLGDFSLPPTDCGDEAFRRSRDRVLLRLTDLKDLTDDDADFDEKLSAAVCIRIAENPADWSPRAVDHLLNPTRRIATQHPLGGWVIVGKKRLKEKDYDVSFLEDDESSESPARREVSLVEHSQGVADYARRFATGCRLDQDLFVTAGLFHDIGKLDPRFQAMLKGRSPRTAGGVALAKSASFGAGNRLIHLYPAGARHELLSTAMIAAKSADDLLLHLIATHHGSARPFASPVAENDAAKAPFSQQLFAQSFRIESAAQNPAKWNPDLSERFWRVVRRFGWWGAAFREAVFRLADHAQSRKEQDEDPRTIEIPVPAVPSSVATSIARYPIELVGLDGSNPLCFLTALGVLRLADEVFADKSSLGWTQRGHWIPVLYTPISVSMPRLVELLHNRVHRVADPAASENAETLHKEYRSQLKAVEAAMKSIKDRKLRGTERAAAIASDVTPLQNAANVARAIWLHGLEAAVPAQFLSIGKALSVTADEFRAFACRTVEQLLTKGPSARIDADFTSAFGCEICASESGRIIPTEFQLITGSGHQFFLETIHKLMEAVTVEQLHRALAGPWTYADPRLSLRWDPIDDRRYAYNWNDPSSEIVRTEHGANLLASFALPLFPFIPTNLGPVTTGFSSDSKQAKWTWPIWKGPASLDVIRSLLALKSLQDVQTNRTQLTVVQVMEAFRVEKIEVGRPPLSKLNFGAAISA